jgi:uncharacterized protein (DUF885 family)
MLKRFFTGALVTLLLALLGGCFQAEINGPVAGAQITISELRDPGVVHARVRSQSRASLIRNHGEKAWDGFDPGRRLLMLGVFSLDLQHLQDDRLYRVRASGGKDTDVDRDGREDATYTPVAGRWRAIMSGAQLKSHGPRVSALTEALFLWLERDLTRLDDRLILYNLDRAARRLVTDVDGNAAVSGTDLLHWSRLFSSEKLLAGKPQLDLISENLLAGADVDERRKAARELVGIEVDRDTPPAVYLPPVLTDQLTGLTLQDFFSVSYRWLLQRSPEAVVELGLEASFGEGDVRLDNVSDEYEATTDKLAEVILTALEKFDRKELSAADRISRDIYEWHLRDRLEGAQYRLHDYPASSFITSIPSRTLFFFTDIHPLVTEQDARDYLQRLRGVADKFVQLRKLVAARADRSVIEPAITLDWSIDGLRSTARTRATSTGYYRRFSTNLEQIPGMTDATAEQLRAMARAVIEEQVQPAYAGLIDDLEVLRGRAPNAIGVSQFAGGAEFYAWALGHHTTTAMTADEVHQLGLDELRRVHAEIRDAATTLGYSRKLDLVELFERISLDGGLLSGNDILSTYESIVSEASERLPEAFELLPRQPVVVIGGTTGGFYVGGSGDGTRPGAFYAATRGQEARYMMPSLAYHEAVPGHHLQIALAQEQPLPDFRRYLNYTAFVEGWALYAERLAFELGWYATDPYGNLGRLQFEAIRAARLAVDTGIHARGWSWDQAVSFYRRNTGASLYSAQGNVGRFMRWPGQATSYMIGMKKLLQLRAQLAQSRGQDYDIREFHRQVLSGAAMPLDILQQSLTSDSSAGDR